MKKWLWAFLGLLVCYTLLCIGLANGYGAEYQESMSKYKDNYFIAGNEEDQTKVQVSVKYNILYPSETGLNLGYTQTSNWLCYDGRDTFYTMYQPEAFYIFESGQNVFNNYVIPYVDYIQVSPICHNSTGVEGENHRSINIYYGQVQASVGDVFNFGLNLKGFGYYTMAKNNKDIRDYKGNYEAKVFFRYRSKTVSYLDKEELAFSFGGYDKSDYDHERKGWYCVEAKFRILTSYVQPKLFFSWYRGFNEFMVNYNKKTDSIRVGLVF